MKPNPADRDVVGTETFIKRTLELALRAKGFVWIAATFGTVVLVTTSLRFGFSLAVIVLGATIFLAFAFLFFLLSRAVKLPIHRTERPLLVVVWALTILFIGITLLLASSAFFDKPLPFRTWILTKLGSSENIEKVAETKAERSSNEQPGPEKRRADAAKASEEPSSSAHATPSPRVTLQTAPPQKGASPPVLVRLIALVAALEIPDQAGDEQRNVLEERMRQGLHAVQNKIHKVIETSPYNIGGGGLLSRSDRPPFLFGVQAVTTRPGMSSLDLEVRYFEDNANVQTAAEEVLRSVRVAFRTWKGRVVLSSPADHASVLDQPLDDDGEIGLGQMIRNQERNSKSLFRAQMEATGLSSDEAERSATRIFGELEALPTSDIEIWIGQQLVENAIAEDASPSPTSRTSPRAKKR